MVFTGEEREKVFRNVMETHKYIMENVVSKISRLDLLTCDICNGQRVYVLGNGKVAFWKNNTYALEITPEGKITQDTDWWMYLENWGYIKEELECEIARIQRRKHNVTFGFEV